MAKSQASQGRQASSDHRLLDNFLKNEPIIYRLMGVKTDILQINHKTKEKYSRCFVLPFTLISFKLNPTYLTSLEIFGPPQEFKMMFDGFGQHFVCRAWVCKEGEVSCRNQITKTPPGRLSNTMLLICDLGYHFCNGQNKPVKVNIDEQSSWQCHICRCWLHV